MISIKNIPNILNIKKIFKELLIRIIFKLHIVTTLINMQYPFHQKKSPFIF